MSTPLIFDHWTALVWTEVGTKWSIGHASSCNNGFTKIKTKIDFFPALITSLVFSCLQFFYVKTFVMVFFCYCYHGSSWCICFGNPKILTTWCRRHLIFPSSCSVRSNTGLPMKGETSKTTVRITVCLHIFIISWNCKLDCFVANS